MIEREPTKADFLRHVDGQVDLGQGCGDCHGGPGDPDGIGQSRTYSTADPVGHNHRAVCCWISVVCCRASTSIQTYFTRSYLLVHGNELNHGTVVKSRAWNGNRVFL